MLVGPPEQLKTQFISILADHPRVLILSDLTTRELSDFSADLGGTYKTLGFTAFEKVSQRDASVAQNLIGHITALAEEGFTGSYRVDKRQRIYKSKVMVVGAVPSFFYESNFKEWMASGFHRRFLWPQFRLSDPDMLRESIINWAPVDLRQGSMGFPIPGGPIPFNVTAGERKELARCLRSTEGIASPLILLTKIFAVLSWRYRSPVTAMAVIQDFAQSLRGVADMEIGAIPEVMQLVQDENRPIKPKKGKR